MRYPGNTPAAAGAALLTLSLALAAARAPIAGARQNGADLAKRAGAILKARCSACHGDTNPTKNVNVLKVQSLIDLKVLKPGKAAESKLIQLIENGSMPFGGEKLPAEEIRTLKACVDSLAAGKPVERP